MPLERYNTTGITATATTAGTGRYFTRDNAVNLDDAIRYAIADVGVAQQLQARIQRREKRDPRDPGYLTWSSASEHKPRDAGLVLAYDGFYRGMHLASYDKDSDSWQDENNDPTFPTHWLYLPNPPVTHDGKEW